MLSKYISKFIELLKEEVALYEWAKSNSPNGYDISALLDTYIATNRVNLTASEGLKYAYDDSSFGYATLFIFLVQPVQLIPY